MIVDALADQRFAEWHTGRAKEAMLYDGQEMSPATRRALELLKGCALMVAPDDSASVPWQDTLEELTGTHETDASAIIDYFAPLMVYLREQDEGRSCAW